MKEEFYGGKGERDPRRKGKEMMIRKGPGVVKRERRGNPLGQRGHWKRKRRRSLGRKGGRFFRGSMIKASWTRVLFGDDCGLFIEPGSVSDDHDKKKEKKKKEKK